uniref:Uncharacterized protein n=1 Tax=Cyprinus carpio TaxID=7962 RepID=A0A8C2CJF4_CYPCA
MHVQNLIIYSNTNRKWSSTLTLHTYNVVILLFILFCIYLYTKVELYVILSPLLVTVFTSFLIIYIFLNIYLFVNNTLSS